MSRFTFIDLFSGIGGFHLGAKRNGGICVGFSEVDKNAINAYCVNHNSDYYNNFGDIRQIKNLPSHDFLTAGVPCQSWSIAGKNLGFEDERGQLWNDTIFLLNKSRPKAFIFENVKGLSEPRNKEALDLIMKRIRKSGYHANYYVLNSNDFGSLQNRKRVYIIGFRKSEYFKAFNLPTIQKNEKRLHEVLDNLEPFLGEKRKFLPEEIYGSKVPVHQNNGQNLTEVNDFFLFNDIRNGHSTIHTWDLKNTTEKEKQICYAILKNRRKKKFGPRDGNPLSVSNIRSILNWVTKSDLKKLVKKGILKEVAYTYKLTPEIVLSEISKSERRILEFQDNGKLKLENLYSENKTLLKSGVKFQKSIESLSLKNYIKPDTVRYEFKNSKISSGIDGVNRIFLPSSKTYSTLVASDTNDFVALRNVVFNSPSDYKESFVNQIFSKNHFRKITKSEACVLQGFPKDFILYDQRNKWMKLIGNSVSIPVVERLTRSIVETGVFDC